MLISSWSPKIRGGNSRVRGGNSRVRGGKTRSVVWDFICIPFMKKIQGGHVKPSCVMSLQHPWVAWSCSLFSGPIQLGRHMPRQLLSRVFSTETLAAGLQLVKTEAGMSDLSDLNLQELEAELRELEAGHVDLLQFVDLLMFWYPLFHPLPWAIPFHIPLSI